MKAYMKPAFNLVPLSADDLVPGSCSTESDFDTIFDVAFDHTYKEGETFLSSMSCSDMVDELYGLIRFECKFEAEGLLFVS